MVTDEGRAPAVELDSVSFSYGDTPAVRDASLTLDCGDFLGLVGPNGSGKTTLLRIMLGLLEPDEGEARLFGERAVSNDENAGRVGYVSQKSSDRGGTMPVTVRETVTMGRFSEAGRRLSDDDRRAVADALERVGIEDLADRRLSALSGGQRQRAYIARALASEADLLALDEPATGVDAESRDAFYGLLDELNDEGMTVVLIEHDIGVVTEHADTVACINVDMYYHGETEDFDADEVLAEAYGETAKMLHHDHSHGHSHG